MSPSAEILPHHSDPVSRPSTDKNHLNYLDGLRAVAALYVLLHHCSFYAHDIKHEAPAFFGLLYNLLPFGHYAVTIFIILSGFCLMLPVTRKGALQGGAKLFFAKRARRILPPYYMALGLSLFFIATIIGNPPRLDVFWLWTQSLPVTFKDILFHILLIHDLFPSTSNKINPVFWSIAVEWRIYFLFPVILLLWEKFGPYRVTAGFVLVSFLCQLCLRYTPLNDGETGVCLHYIGLFVVGMLACEFAFANKAFYQFRDRVPWRIIALMSLLGLAVFRYKARPFYYCDLFVALWAFSALVYVSRNSKSIFKSILTWKPMVFIGTFAYSIYLTHPVILQIIMQYGVVPAHLNPVLMSILTLFVVPLLCLLGAYAFFLCCERPFMNTKKS